MISIVIPVYNEEANVAELHKRVKDVMVHLSHDYEIIAVDDGSKDATVDVLKTLSPIKIIRFAKNAGQTSAMDAGFKAAKGDIIINMDGDLQNDPDDIPRLIETINQGYDVVSGWRQDRQDSSDRKVLSRCANWLTCKVTGLYLHDSACALKAYRAEVLKGIDLFGEMHVFLPSILYMRGAKVAELRVKHHERFAGVSKHSFMKALRNLSDLLVIKFIFRYMSRPLLFFISIAAAFLLIGALSLVATVLFWFHGSHIASAALIGIFAVGVASACMTLLIGLLAEILLRIYYHDTRKPYLIKDVIEVGA